MQVRRTASIGMVLAFALAACNDGAATQGPGGGTANPGGATTNPGGATTPPATQGPVATVSGNTGGGSGQIHIEIGGPMQETVDQPFFSIGSRFGGVAGTALQFTSEGADGIATISEVNGLVVVSWVDSEVGANSQSCTLSNWNIGTTSGSGSFDCKDGFATKMDGTFLSGVTMKGSFQASQ